VLGPSSPRTPGPPPPPAPPPATPGRGGGGAAALGPAIDAPRREGGVRVRIVPTERMPNVAVHRSIDEAVAAALAGLD